MFQRIFIAAVLFFIALSAGYMLTTDFRTGALLAAGGALFQLCLFWICDVNYVCERTCQQDN